jgi:CheY-like chemotaxis protein
MPDRIVFVVGGDASFRRAATQSLADSGGLQAVSMAGGTSLLPLARSARPAAIVIDLATPDLDAGALLRRLDSATDTRGIPVVGVLAEGDEAAPPAGVAALLHRPLSHAAIVDAVRALLQPAR